jgi:hypothetical protein
MFASYYVSFIFFSFHIMFLSYFAHFISILMYSLVLVYFTRMPKRIKSLARSFPKKSKDANMVVLHPRRDMKH